MLAAAYRQALRRDRIRRILMDQEEMVVRRDDNGTDYTQEASLQPTHVNRDFYS